MNARPGHTAIPVHQWNVVLNSNRHWVPFQGGEKNPDEFTAINDSVKAPKIYRHHFSAQKEEMFDLNDHDIPPIFLNSHLMVDVTNQYISVSDVIVEVDTAFARGNVLYLSVFNAEQWCIVARAPIINNRAVFKNMSNNRIVYLPVSYKDHEIKPASNAFILSREGIAKLAPDLKNLRDVELTLYNKFFDYQWRIGYIQPGRSLGLFYWNDQWVSCGEFKISKDSTLQVPNVPEGALLLIKSYEWDNTWQRIFTVQNNKQIWY